MKLEFPLFLLIVLLFGNVVHYFSPKYEEIYLILAVGVVYLILKKLGIMKKNVSPAFGISLISITLFVFFVIPALFIY
ncbi:hypothetical protein [Bacillus sp. SM2101]|uniref:hypothetical protein n=1 Tax=Bacillus sp. SM2101 TaxID=2805366 RepID=UPI001BDF035E|nr:hypothetical protein [Bacillus sp. SM2101]